MALADDDLESIHGGSTKLFSQRFLDSARQADLLLHVVRAFESDTVPYHETVDPLRDQQLVDEEMILSDLHIVENRLERLAKSMNVKSPGHPDYLEKQLFEKVRPVLEEGKPLRAIDLDEAARRTALARLADEDSALANDLERMLALDRESVGPIEGLRGEVAEAARRQLLADQDAELAPTWKNCATTPPNAARSSPNGSRCTQNTPSIRNAGSRPRWPRPSSARSTVTVSRAPISGPPVTPTRRRPPLTSLANSRPTA